MLRTLLILHTSVVAPLALVWVFDGIPVAGKAARFLLIVWLAFVWVRGGQMVGRPLLGIWAVVPLAVREIGAILRPAPGEGEGGQVMFWAFLAGLAYVAVMFVKWLHDIACLWLPLWVAFWLAVDLAAVALSLYANGLVWRTWYAAELRRGEAKARIENLGKDAPEWVDGLRAIGMDGDAMHAARERYEALVRAIDGLGLDPHEAQSARDAAKMKFLKEVDGMLKT